MLCCKKKKTAEETSTSNFIVVIGGANGLGLATVESLLINTNFTIFVGDIDIKGLYSLKTKYNKYGFRLHTIPLNITEKESILKFINEIESIKLNEKNKIKLNPYCYQLIISVGIFIAKPILDLSIKEFDNIINVNVLGIWKVVKLFYQQNLLKHNQNINKNPKYQNTRIIIFSSELGLCHPIPFRYIYIYIIY